METGALRLVVGLGDPGQRYAGTAHNVGIVRLEWLDSRGLKAVGQSSWGPTGFAVCPSEATADHLKAEAETRFGCEFGLDFAVTCARNHGADVESTLSAH